MGNSVRSVLHVGTDGLLIDIECHLSNSLPGIVIVGLGGKAIEEAKERIRGAFANSKIELPRKKITVNLAPADIPKEGTSLDLAIAASILVADQKIKKVPARSDAIIGELGLDGIIRPVRGIIGKLVSGKKLGIEQFYIPADNLQQALLVPDVTVVPLKSLEEFYRTMNDAETAKKVTTTIHTPLPTPNKSAGVYLHDIIGQAHAKRAVEIAVAGGHNILFMGPPGTGKSMLAKSMINLLPKMTREEVLEATHIHSLANRSYDQLVTTRPFRAPHHSASHPAIIGGGNSLRPGEISLSHHGILFFDELPEFNRTTIEALRQPLEDRVITISRIKDSVNYPANFIFVATANPCPCGYFGSTKACICTANQINRYRQKLSGPIMDRIDIHVTVDQVDHEHLLSKNDEAATLDKNMAANIEKTRKIQQKRFGLAKLNAEMTNRDIKNLVHLHAGAKSILDEAAKSLEISARSYMRIIKIAQTIADLDNISGVKSEHIAEALQYRHSHNTQT